MSQKDETPGEKNRFLKHIEKVLRIIESSILIASAITLLFVAGYILVQDVLYEDLFIHSHPVEHLIREILFVLIVIELFKQVWRVVERKPFSLNPFLYIGFIVTIRGIIFIQSSMGDEVDREMILMMLAYAIVLLVLVFSYWLYAKVKRDPSQD